MERLGQERHGRLRREVAVSERAAIEYKLESRRRRRQRTEDSGNGEKLRS
jgi:hypothetical protein